MIRSPIRFLTNFTPAPGFLPPFSLPPLNFPSSIRANFPPSPPGPPNESPLFPDFNSLPSDPIISDPDPDSNPEDRPVPDLDPEGIPILPSLLSTRLILNAFFRPKPSIIANTVFVAPLSPPVDRLWLGKEIDDLLQLEDGKSGQILRIKVVQDRFGKKNGIGFIEFSNKKLVARLLKYKDFKIDRLAVSFEPSQSPIFSPYQIMNQKPPPEISSPTIFISHLSPSPAEENPITQKNLHQTFSQFGQIIRMSIPKRKDGSGSFGGNAFVTFSDQASADRVVMKYKEEGFLVGNKKVKVEYSSSLSRACLQQPKKSKLETPIKWLEREKQVSRELNRTEEVKKETIDQEQKIEKEEKELNTDVKLSDQELENESLPVKLGFDKLGESRMEKRKYENRRKHKQYTFWIDRSYWRFNASKADTSRMRRMREMTRPRR